MGCKVGIDATRPLYKDDASFEKPGIPQSENVKRIIKDLTT
jgi:hypothetical protein